MAFLLPNFCGFIVFTAGPIIIKGRYTQPGEGFITLSGMLPIST